VFHNLLFLFLSITLKACRFGLCLYVCPLSFLSACVLFFLFIFRNTNFPKVGLPCPKFHLFSSDYFNLCLLKSVFLSFFIVLSGGAL
jgi:hypothetical protein